MTIVLRSIFHKGNKFYLKVFLDECLYKLSMLEYDTIDVSEEFNVKEPLVCMSVLFVNTDTFMS